MECLFKIHIWSFWRESGVWEAIKEQQEACSSADGDATWVFWAAGLTCMDEEARQDRATLPWAVKCQSSKCNGNETSRHFSVMAPFRSRSWRFTSLALCSSLVSVLTYRFLAFSWAGDWGFLPRIPRCHSVYDSDWSCSKARKFTFSHSACTCDHGGVTEGLPASSHLQRWILMGPP